jgi:hypothetical protein
LFYQDKFKVKVGALACRNRKDMDNHQQFWLDFKALKRLILHSPVFPPPCFTFVGGT